jgi:acetolactate synthase I/II/III large subunit
MTMIDGNRLLAEMMRGYGVSHVFFVPTIVLPALAAMEEMPIRRMMVHGEKAAAYMADGYARASGRPGICMAQNIGGSNLAAGLRDAFMACTPLIAITGGPAPMGRYRHAYQEVEDHAQWDCVTKMNVRVDDLRRFPDLLRQAFRVATSGTPGPVHIELSGSHGQVLEAAAELDGSVEPLYARIPPFRPASDGEALARAVERIGRAARPIIVAGGGVVASDARRELLAFAERFAIPVATSLNAKDCMPDAHRLSVGVVGTYSRRSANESVAGADLVIFVGSQAGAQVTHLWSVPPVGTEIIQIDINPEHIGRNYAPTLPVLADARLALAGLAALAPPEPPSTRAAWLTHIAGLKEEWRRQADARRHGVTSPMRPEPLCAEISDLLPPGGCVVSDTGHSGLWTAQMIELRHPDQRYYRCTGSLGWGFPGALGVKCARPQSAVIGWCGDGGFYYHLAELETAARYGIDAIIVVNNNAMLNQEIPLFKAAYGGTLGPRAGEMFAFRDTDFAAVAENLGCLGLRATTRAEFRDALGHALQAKRPVVIDAVTDAEAQAERAWRPSPAASYNL